MATDLAISHKLVVFFFFEIKFVFSLWYFVCQVHDLRADLCNGLKLISLVEVLQNKAGGPGPSRGLRRIRNPLNQHQYLENVQVALNAIAADNVKLVNIGRCLNLYRNIIEVAMFF